MFVRGFIRDEIVGIEVAFRLRPGSEVLVELKRRNLNIGRCDGWLMGTGQRNDCQRYRERQDEPDFWNCLAHLGLHYNTNTWAFRIPHSRSGLQTRVILDDYANLPKTTFLRCTPREPAKRRGRFSNMS